MKPVSPPSNITIPKSSGWFAARHVDHAGEHPLSPDAQVILALALSFPQFEAPGLEQMIEYHRDMVRSSGSPYRPYGKIRIQTAMAELKKRGFYGLRRASLGRATQSARNDGPQPMAFARSYGNEPGRHLVALEALTGDQIRRHDLAVKVAWTRYRESGIWPGRGMVVSLDERRSARAG